MGTKKRKIRRLKSKNKKLSKKIAALHERFEALQDALGKKRWT